MFKGTDDFCSVWRKKKLDFEEGRKINLPLSATLDITMLVCLKAVIELLNRSNVESPTFYNKTFSHLLVLCWNLFLAYKSSVNAIWERSDVIGKFSDDMSLVQCDNINLLNDRNNLHCKRWWYSLGIRSAS